MPKNAWGRIVGRWALFFQNAQKFLILQVDSIARLNVDLQKWPIMKVDLTQIFFTIIDFDASNIQK